MRCCGVAEFHCARRGGRPTVRCDQERSSRRCLDGTGQVVVVRVLHDESGKGSTGFAACGLAGAIVFTATWIVAGLAYPAFSFVNNDTSDLGALTAAHPTPYNVGLSLSGFLTIGLAVALAMVLGRRRAFVAGSTLVALFGVGQFVDGLAREDCAVSVDAVCRAAEKAGGSRCITRSTTPNRWSRSAP